MEHNFDVVVAARYGIEIAILLKYISFWVAHNKANNQNFNEGRHWSYNTVDAFCVQFPYWSKHQISRFLKKMIDQGLIIKGKFNENPYDQTCWYSLTDLGEEVSPLPIWRNRKIDISKSQNVHLAKSQTVLYTNIKPIKDIKQEPENAELPLPSWLNNELWEEFKQHRRDIKKPMTRLAEKKAIQKLELLKQLGNDPVQVINESMINGWSGLFETKKVIFQPKAPDKNTNKPNNDHNVRSIVKEYGPGHPTWESLHGKNKHNLGKDDSHGSETTSNHVRGNGMRKTTDYLL